MGDVIDLRTGRICKLCRYCHYWKDLKDFNFSAFGKYKRAARCRACSPGVLLAEGQPITELPSADRLNRNWADHADFIFEIEGDDDETA